MEGHAGPRGEWRGASFGAAAVAMETEAADESGFTSVASKRGRRKRRAAGAEPMEAAESAEAAGPQPSKRPAFPPLPAAALGVSAGPGGSGWDGPGGRICPRPLLTAPLSAGGERGGEEGAGAGQQVHPAEGELDEDIHAHRGTPAAPDQV